MPFTFTSDFGDSAAGGFIYVVEQDGTTIIANIENNNFAWHTILNYANTSAPLYVSGDISAGTFGYRFFANTAGAEGSLTGAVEITRYVISRAANAARYSTEAVIAGGVISKDRVSNDMKIEVDTQGGAGTDDLDSIEIDGVVDNDVITLIGLDATHIVTVKDGTGNIFLADGTDFDTEGRTNTLVLRYFSGGVPGWYEVSRKTQQPTVERLRANSVPEPVAGVDVITLTDGGGTINLEPGVDEGYQVITGTVNPLLASWAIQIKAVPATPYLDGDTMIVDYRGNVTPNTPATETITIFGQTLTDAQALGVSGAGRIVAKATYRLATTTWYYQILEQNGDGANGVNMATKPYVDTTFEPYLGTPAADGYVLQSLTDDTRSWVPNQNNVVLHNDTSNNATGAGTSQQILKTYTLPGATMDVDGDVISVRAIFQTAGNVNGKTCSLYFGATKIAEVVADMEDDTVIIDAEVNRIDINNQSSWGRAMVWDTVSTGTSVATNGRYTLPTENVGADLDIECRATDAVDSPEDIICRQFSVSIFKKRN
jgi:hypothetical protein